MDESEIIKITLTESELKLLLSEALEYAALSINFTLDRCERKKGKIIKGKTDYDFAYRMSNIIKGYVSQSVLIKYLVKCGVCVDDETTKTPYYEPDKGDFLIKNNDGKYIEIDYKCFSYRGIYTGDFVDLPALCPTDQFDKGIKNKDIASWAYYIYGWVKDGWFTLTLNNEQKSYLDEMVKESIVKGKYDDPKGFYDKFMGLGNKDEIVINFVPEFVVCGYSTFLEHGKFVKTPERAKYPEINPVVFLRLDNMTYPMRKLNSLKSYIELLTQKLSLNDIAELNKQKDVWEKELSEKEFNDAIEKVDFNRYHHLMGVYSDTYN